MFSAIKLAKINGLDYVFNPFDQKQNDLATLEQVFLKTNLDWIANINLNEIIFYEPIFQKWWNKMVTEQQNRFLAKARQLLFKKLIDETLAKQVFKQFGLNFDHLISWSAKEFNDAYPRIKLERHPALQLNRDLFNTYYQLDFNYHFNFIIDANLKQDQIQAKMNQTLAAIEKQGLIPVLIFLQGAHNYNLDDVDSDYDFKALVIDPDVFKIQEQAITITYSNQNELVDCKYWDRFKQLLSEFSYPYLELLKAKAVVINHHFQTFFESLKQILSQSLSANEYLIKRSIIGQMAHKLDALNKPFASKVAIIKAFGYDPKQLHHYFRLKSVLEAINTKGIAIDNLWPKYDSKQREFLISIKRHGLAQWTNDPEFVIQAKQSLLKDFETNDVRIWKQMPQRVRQKEHILLMKNNLDQLDVSFYDACQKQVKIRKRGLKNKPSL